MTTLRALETKALSLPFHYLERNATVNTVIYGRCTGILRNRNFRNSEILPTKTALPWVGRAGDPVTGVVVDRVTAH